MITGNVLIVDDEPAIRSLVKEILEDEGFNVDVAENAEEAKLRKESFVPDLILLDIWMPGIDGITLLKEWKEKDNLNIPVIMMSGHGTVETAVEATKVGAYDFIEKPLSLAKLILTVKHALETISLQQENLRLRSHSQISSMPIGKSQIMQQLRERISRIANHNTPVLITGESGTDKEVFARYLHSQGNRADAPFIKIVISALSTDHAIQDFFGGEENGNIKPGFLEQAEGGILFIKDIADMDQSLQAKLQTTLENNTLTRIGSTESHQIDVRIVAATSYNIQEMVQNGKFRDDLYYQLNIIPLNIPPLREHYEDIPELLEYYVGYFAEQEGFPYRHFTVATQNHLRGYDWPGNVRELKNLVQRLLILGTKENIDIDEIDMAISKKQKQIDEQETYFNFDLPLREAREQFEKSYLQYKLDQANGSVSKIAKEVGMERTHLYRKLKSLGIDIKN